MIGQSVTLGFFLAKYDSHCLGYLQVVVVVVVVVVVFLNQSKPM